MPLGKSDHSPEPERCLESYGMEDFQTDATYLMRPFVRKLTDKLHLKKGKPTFTSREDGNKVATFVFHEELTQPDKRFETVEEQGAFLQSLKDHFRAGFLRDQWLGRTWSNGGGNTLSFSSPPFFLSVRISVDHLTQEFTRTGRIDIFMQLTIHPR